MLRGRRAPDLELAASGCGRVGAGIGREQHPHVARCVGTEYDNVAILRSLDVDARALARNEGVVRAQRDLDWRIISGTRNRRRVYSGPDRRCE